MGRARDLSGRAALLLWAATAFAGCAGDEGVLPVASATPTAPATSPTPPPDAGPPKRTVIQRNPFGDVAETDNLLFDGDFEWTSPFSDEYGWFQGQNPTVTDVVVGPGCKSGVKCARLAGHQSIIGIGVASKGHHLEASVWARFEDPATPCASAKATLIDRFAGSGTPLESGDPDVHLTPSDAPDQSGWCKLSGVSVPRANRTFLNVFNTSGGKMIVDDAVLKKLAGSSPAPPTNGASPSPSPAPAETWVPTAEEVADLAHARAMLAEWSKPHDGPKTNAQRAFEKLHDRGAP